MKTLEYHTLDDVKKTWGDGPWLTEPDKIQWLDPETGLPCLIVRNPHLGILCGYVGVSSTHPLHGVDYGPASDAIEKNPHGGLTFADKCHPDAEETGICHKVEEGEDDNVWWLGFDCGHGFDLAPGFESRSGMAAVSKVWKDFSARQAYRDVSFVKGEVAELAKTLKAHETRP